MVGKGRKVMCRNLDSERWEVGKGKVEVFMAKRPYMTALSIIRTWSE